MAEVVRPDESGVISTRNAELTDFTANNLQSLDDYVRTHFDSSQKVRAVKFYYDHTGMSLRDAKMAVDRLL